MRDADGTTQALIYPPQGVSASEMIAAGESKARQRATAEASRFPLLPQSVGKYNKPTTVIMVKKEAVHSPGDASLLEEDSSVFMQ